MVVRGPEKIGAPLLVENLFLAECNGKAQGAGAFALVWVVLSNMQEKAAFF